jgi:hypothetical protein
MTEQHLPDIAKLVERIEALEKIDRTKLLDRIERVENLFAEHKAMLYSYMKRHSEFEEMEDRNNILERLQNEKLGYVSSFSIMRNFYLPDSNNLLTDLDGLILMKPRIYNINNNTQLYNANNRMRFRKTMRNRLRANDQQVEINKPLAVIIESKQSLNKRLIDNKLQQFYKLYSILRDTKGGVIDINETSEQFKKMYQNYHLEAFPDELYFVFASNSIDKYCIEYVLHIAQNTLTRELYELYTIQYLRTLHAFAEFCSPKYITKQFIAKLKTTASLTDVIKVLDQYPKNRYSEKIRAEIELYEDMEPIFEYIRGRVGIHMYDDIYIPGVIGVADSISIYQ